MNKIVAFVAQALGLKKSIPAVEQVISDVEEHLAPEVSAPPVIEEEKPKKKIARKKKADA